MVVVEVMEQIWSWPMRCMRRWTRRWRSCDGSQRTEQDWKARLIHVCVFVHNTRKPKMPKKWRKGRLVKFCRWRCLSLQTIQCFLSTWWSKWQWVQDYCKLDTTRNPNSLFFQRAWISKSFPVGQWVLRVRVLELIILCWWWTNADLRFRLCVCANPLLFTC